VALALGKAAANEWAEQWANKLSAAFKA